MLEIIVKGIEVYDEKNNCFTSYKDKTIVLEHSLVSISKWESKWKKPFLTNSEKTLEESIDYIRCMTITQNVTPETYELLSADNLKQVAEYIDDPMTATTFSEKPKGGREVVTAEIIYYWMIALQIPVEFQKWHINKLLTLINVTNIKNSPKKKQSVNEIMSRNKQLNDERRRLLNSKG